MKRNEQKLLGLSEMEDVMQLLLGRQLWDPYGRNVNSADELVNDFVGFTNDVTRESLQKPRISNRYFACNITNRCAGLFAGQVQPHRSKFVVVLQQPGLATLQASWTVFAIA